MASNLKLLPVCFGVNMCETTFSHAQYVDDVWCMCSHLRSSITNPAPASMTREKMQHRARKNTDRIRQILFAPSKTIGKLFTCTLTLRKTFHMLRQQNWRWSQSPRILGAVCFRLVARYQTQLDTTSQIVSEAGKNLEHAVPAKGHCQEGTWCFSFPSKASLCWLKHWQVRLPLEAPKGEGDASPSSV